MLDQEIGLVGRDETVALVELLVRSRPLPILVAFGPGGSGKSALLDHVERRYRDWPVSRVNLDGMGSTDCKEVLAAIVDDLRKYSHPEFGTFRLPRYTIARLAMASAANATDAGGDADRRTLARNLLAARLTKLPKVPQVLAAAADLMPPIMGSSLRIIQPLLAFAAGFGVNAPRWLRPLLVGSRMASALRWYETVAPRDDLLGMATPIKAPAAVMALWRRLGRRDEGSQRQIDRLFVAAFLADIDTMFRRRHRRKVTCIVLLDGADMLEPFTDSLFESNSETTAPANNFIELLAEARLTTPNAPLLVIATKQAQVDRLPDTGPEPLDPEPARACYDRWLGRFRREPTARNVHLSVPLLPFTLHQTAQFLAEWSRTQDYPIAQPTLIRELHQVTRGHPLAVELAVRATGLRFRANNARPAVRDAFRRQLPEGQRTADPSMTVGDYLHFRFLQRFRGGDDAEERRHTQELLARLAAARRIDVATIRLLAPDRDPQDVLDRLRKYSFADSVGVDGQDCLTLHPLLRDLLAGRLQTMPGSPYRAVHQKLRNHYRAVGNRTEELYHCLALGEIEVVARELRDRARRSDPGWPMMLDSIAEAPTDSEPRLTRRMRRIHAAAVQAITMDVAAVHDLVLATWRLRSVTGTEPALPAMFNRVADAYEQVGRRLTIGNTAMLGQQEARYRELAQPTTEYDPETVAAPLPAASERDQRVDYPRPRLTRRWRRGIAFGAATVLIGGYAAAFVIEQRTYCDVGNPVNVSSVVGSIGDPTLYLAREPNDQCVGLTTSATEFAYGDRAQPGDPTEVKDLNEIAELSRLIYLQNEQVDSISDDNGPRSVTVVVATMLSTVDVQPYRDLTAGVNELRGAYLAQRQWNQINSPKHWPGFFVRLALANIGGDSAYAMRTADQIMNYARQNPSVIAVTGMGQTRDQTLQAATMLGTPSGSWQGIPVVTTAPTGDGFASKPDVFMIAPTDDRQAQVAAAFIRSRSDLANRDIYLVYDSSDPYSTNLRDDYITRLQADSLTVHQREPYDASAQDLVAELTPIERDVCADPGNPLVIYVGRANEFPTLVGDMPCGSRATIIGDDDLTQTETENYNDLTQLDLQKQVAAHVYYTSFAGTCPDITVTANDSCQAQNNVMSADFTSLYRSEASQEQADDGGAAFQTGWNGEVMLAYDGVTLVLNATAAAHVRDRQDVQEKLQGMTAQGLAGQIDFQQRRQPGGVDPQKQVVVEELATVPGNAAELMPQVVFQMP